MTHFEFPTVALSFVRGLAAHLAPHCISSPENQVELDAPDLGLLLACNSVRRLVRGIWPCLNGKLDRWRFVLFLLIVLLLFVTGGLILPMRLGGLPGGSWRIFPAGWPVGSCCRRPV